MKNCGADAVVAVVVVAAVVDDAELLLSWLWGASEIKRMLNFCCDVFYAKKLKNAREQQICSKILQKWFFKFAPKG